MWLTVRFSSFAEKTRAKPAVTGVISRRSTADRLVHSLDGLPRLLLILSSQYWFCLLTYSRCLRRVWSIQER